MAKETKVAVPMDIASLLASYAAAQIETKAAENVLIDKRNAERAALNALGAKVVPAEAVPGEKFTIVFEDPAFDEPQRYTITKSATIGYDIAEWKPRGGRP